MNNNDGAPPAERQLWLVPSDEPPRHGLVADVAVQARVPRVLTYAVPPELAPHVQPGVYVRVPRRPGGRLLIGLCVRTSSQPWDHARPPVAEVLGPQPPLPPTILELGLWIGEYYACPPGLALAAMVPTAARHTPTRRVACLRLTGAVPSQPLTPKQQAVLAALATGPQPRTEVLRSAGAGPGVAATLRKLGLIDVLQERRPRPPDAGRRSSAAAVLAERCACPEDDYTLTPGQQAALTEILDAVNTSDAFRVFLLFGVPGSGKTEVYVRAVRQVVAAGRQAVLLVPEIMLATQIVQRLARRFDRVAVLHGRLTPAARRDTWHAVRAGAVDVVIGTRSAAFAPAPRLGLIVVDEEQDDSFKNLTMPFYHARDVAIKRAQLERIPVVLGSATPALETWHNAQTLPHFRLLRLPQRTAGASLPHTRLLHRPGAGPGQTASVLSADLLHALRDTLAAGQQAILLHNRRGYAVHLRCTRCGIVVTCTRCGARLVYHQPDESARCHRCGLREAVPHTCLDATCAGELERLGLAIQRLEEELTRTLPAARLLRIDRDTLRRRQDYEAALRRFEAHEADLLIGTQMVAKGLDFPSVRLVGVVDADAALSLPDFRAAEHVFQLVTQVVGRAGRREGPALAVIQSADVTAPAIRCALHMDYEAFARQELAARHRFAYPPFTRMLRLVLADDRPARAREEAQRLADGLRQVAGRVHSRIVVHEACPCAVARRRRLLRYEVLVRGPRDGSLQRLLREADAAGALTPRVRRFTIDVDPLDLL